MLQTKRKALRLAYFPLSPHIIQCFPRPAARGPAARAGPSLPPSAGNSVAFGLLRDGCPLSPARAGGGGGGRPTWAEFAGPVSANGYFLEIPAGPPEADPVRWIVEVPAGDEGGGADDGSGLELDGGGGGGDGDAGRWRAVDDPYVT